MKLVTIYLILNKITFDKYIILSFKLLLLTYNQSDRNEGIIDED